MGGCWQAMIGVITTLMGEWGEKILILGTKEQSQSRTKALCPLSHGVITTWDGMDFRDPISTPTAALTQPQLLWEFQTSQPIQIFLFPIPWLLALQPLPKSQLSWENSGKLPGPGGIWDLITSLNFPWESSRIPKFPSPSRSPLALLLPLLFPPPRFPQIRSHLDVRQQLCPVEKELGQDLPGEGIPDLVIRAWNAPVLDPSPPRAESDPKDPKSQSWGIPLPVFGP